MDRRVIPLQRAIEQTKRRNSDVVYPESRNGELGHQSRGYEEQKKMLNGVFESPPELMYIPIV